MLMEIISFIVTGLVFAVVTGVAVYGFCKVIDCFTQTEDPWK